MKKKVIKLSALFLLVISFFLSTAVLLNRQFTGDGSTPSFSLSAEDKYEALTVSGDITIDVGVVFSFADKFMPYVTDEEKL